MTLFQPWRCETVEVAARDAGETGLRDPGEELRAVEELEAVHERRELGVTREPLRQPTRVGSRLVVERMRRDERGAGLDGRLDRLVDAGVDGDEGAEPERQRVRRQPGIGVVVGELEARHDEQAVLPARPRRLALDLGQVGVERGGDDGVRRLRGALGPADVVGDAEDVEAVRPVEIDERRYRQHTVAPGRVRVQLREEGPRSGSRHAHIVGTEHSAMVEK